MLRLTGTPRERAAGGLRPRHHRRTDRGGRFAPEVTVSNQLDRDRPMSREEDFLPRGGDPHSNES